MCYRCPTFPWLQQEIALKPKVYIETSIPSYLTAWRSRDLVVAGNQETTREWWDRRNDFELYISEFVLQEVSNGDPRAAAHRLKALEDIPEIEITEQVAVIAEKLLGEASLPSKARVDALHIATAAIGGMDYLLTRLLKMHCFGAFSFMQNSICDYSVSL
jgi:predicted nucleic acid-binding protein